MFARFDENQAMTFQDIKETKRYGRTDARTHGQRENSIPTTKFAGDIKNKQRVNRYIFSQLNSSQITNLPGIQAHVNSPIPSKHVASF